MDHRAEAGATPFQQATISAFSIELRSSPGYYRDSVRNARATELPVVVGRGQLKS